MKSIVKRVLRKLPFKFGEKDSGPLFTKDLLKGRGFDIGAYTYGLPNVLHWGEKSTLRIGKFCSIADDVTIFLGGNHRTDWITTYPFVVINKDFPNATSVVGHPSTKGDVVIGNDVWIGKAATIMSGVSVGDGAVIAANSVITKDVKPYEIVGGNPATHIRFRFSDQAIQRLLQIRWWDWNIDDINKQVKNLCGADVDQFIKDNQ